MYRSQRLLISSALDNNNSVFQNSQRNSCTLRIFFYCSWINPLLFLHLWCTHYYEMFYSQWSAAPITSSYWHSKSEGISTYDLILHFPLLASFMLLLHFCILHVCSEPMCKKPLGICLKGRTQSLNANDVIWMFLTWPSTERIALSTFPLRVAFVL